MSRLRSTLLLWELAYRGRAFPLSETAHLCRAQMRLFAAELAAGWGHDPILAPHLAQLQAEDERQVWRALTVLYVVAGDWHAARQAELMIDSTG